MRKIKVSAPGKIILSGEHSVVYGQPAVVTALDKRLFVEIEKTQEKTKIISNEEPSLAYYAFLKIEEYLGEKLPALRIKIDSEIPVNRGMGSSAALAVAMAAALFNYLKKELDKTLINQIAFAIEKKQHGKPSGCDNSIATFGRTIVFKKGKIKPLKIKPNFGSVLIDSGRTVESTGEMVTAVRQKFQKSNAKCQTILKKMGKVTVQLIKELKKGEFNKSKNFSRNSLFVSALPRRFRQGDGYRLAGDEVKSLISTNEKLLEELGVVGEKAQKIIREIEAISGAAKICGAGGIKGGSGIILGLCEDQELLRDFLQKQKLEFFDTKINQEGVRIEKS